MSSSPYPPQAIKPASYELMITLLGGGLTLLIVAGWASFTVQNAKVVANANQSLMMQILLLAGCGCTIASLVLNYIYLFRAWAGLQNGRARTTPGAAIGLLFIPLFNYYWIFVAFYGLAQEWNRITGRFPDTRRGPKMSEGLFLAYCICIIVFPPVAFVLWFVVMHQICKAVTFMALPPQHRLRVSQMR